MELLFNTISILLVEQITLEKPLKKLKPTHLSVRRPQFWLVVVMRYRQAFRPTMLSATLRDFLPVKLEPLGFSLTGQLRVAS